MATVVGLSSGYSTAPIPRGRPKSGRVWRAPGEKKKSVQALSGPRMSWDKIKVKRAEAKAVKELERELKMDAQKKREQKKERTAEKRRRKMENEKKAEVVQKITNVAKLKRLKKKQLRNIEKR